MQSLPHRTLLYEQIYTDGKTAKSYPAGDKRKLKHFKRFTEESTLTKSVDILPFPVLHWIQTRKRTGFMDAEAKLSQKAPFK